MAVAILPYGLPQKHFCDLARIPIGELTWPLGERPAVGCLADLSPDDHLIVFASSKIFSASRRQLNCRVSLLLLEPPIIQRRYYRALRFVARNYHRILTHNTDVLTRTPNGRFLAHGGTFLKEIPAESFSKTNRIALIASNKRDTPGQRLRHELAAWSRQHAPDLDLLGYGYRPLDDKSQGHLPYQFSVVIENSRTPGYFTEKLVDSFLCSSVPLYWGAPDIEHFFDPRGMIVCRDSDDLRQAIHRVNSDEFNRRRPALLENRQRALQYRDCLPRAAKLLLDEYQMETRSR